MQVNGRPRVLALCIASNQCIPSENVRVLDLVEDIVGIRHGGGERDEGEDEVFAHFLIGEGEAMSYGEGMDLFEFVDGGGTRE